MVDCSVAGFRPCNEIQTGYVDDCLMSKNQVQDECLVHVLPDGMHADSAVRGDYRLCRLTAV